jgi:hypothetical protein
VTTWSTSAGGKSATVLTPEVTASGTVAYTYNWFTGSDSLTAGWHMLTFGLVTDATSPIGSGPSLSDATIDGVVAPGST